jgi:hexosaminidase
MKQSILLKLVPFWMLFMIIDFHVYPQDSKLMKSKQDDKRIKVSLIPEPKEIKVLDGFFKLSVLTGIQIKDIEIDKSCELFNDFIFDNYGFRLSKHKKKGAIKLILDKNMNAESYELLVNETNISIKGNQAGIFYGLQSLQQLIISEQNNILKIPCVEIFDEPRFAYRGLHLDVCRHFFSVEYVKRYIDLMASYKLNTFHWHLTEDQAWRVEIKRYPELTRKAAWRNSFQIGYYKEQQDKVPHGGFYTQEQIKDVVKYASERHVNIIPEIEMPGHTKALLSVHPELSCTGGPFAIPTYWGVFEDIACAGKDTTFSFFQYVLDEIIDLFPSEYIHIGGDEAPKKRWKKCSHCQNRIRLECLKDEHELQSYFIRRIEKYINSRGRKIIGWDEILDGGLAPNATVMSWRGEQGGIEAATKGHNVIMTPNHFMYFDYYQSDDKEAEPIGPNFPDSSPLSIEMVYNYEPCTNKLSVEQQQFIIGVQANLWGEFLYNQNKADYMAYPRVLALSEIAWSPAEKKNYDYFTERLPERLAQLDKQRVMFRIPEPDGWDNILVEDGMVVVNLRPMVKGAQIYYTTDGSSPLENGKLYLEILRLPVDSTKKSIKVVVQLSSGRSSGIFTHNLY